MLEYHQYLPWRPGESVLSKEDTSEMLAFDVMRARNLSDKYIYDMLASQNKK